MYLAINQDVYNDFFTNRFIQELIAEHQLKLLIFDAVQEEISLFCQSPKSTSHKK
ncbi:element excision factor XisH family protein [Planktothrix tepida]|uniref:Uncharacterized protein n=1 Tax=Planktothrix tepida PCC 9214 TaxID=671072 RepID=A0A1J1LS07_9CYAN|nr:hypothetical protein PL9214670013 [Planktothrix tepida PCC 9214]